jgi:1-acyl-sn-glycerol-3-phosphate acyltransferase
VNRARRVIVALVRVATLMFFRRIEVVGGDNLPTSGGGLLVSWHPNGLIDPALIVATCPRPVAFGARHGLFSWPLLGWVLRAVGTVPLYRKQDLPGGDETARRAANQKSLEAMAQAITSGSFAAIFPEGVSHDAPHLMTLRAGAARLYDVATKAAVVGVPMPVIVPVGLHYDDKDAFRSSVLVAFHAPIDVSDLYPRRGDARAECPESKLTARIQEALTRAIHPTESWRLNQIMHRTAQLLRAERAERSASVLEAPSLRERTLAFQRVWTGYNLRRNTDPEATAALLERVAQYDADMRALGLDEADLDRDPKLETRTLLAIQ